MTSRYDKLDVEQKFAKIIVDLRPLRPFYSAIYEALERVEVEDEFIPTMGVTTNKMLYNKEFIEKLPYSEFMFINLHEIAHVALMHVSRRGKRDPQLWNIACDLYVNKLLSEEFNIQPGDTDSSRNITMPTSGCWCSSIDTDTECAESIYEEFEKQAKQNGYFKDCMNGGGDSESDVKAGDKKQYKFTYKGTNRENNSRSSGSGSNPFGSSNSNKGDTFETKINVKFVGGDIIDTGEDDLKKENDNKKVLSEAKTRYEMSQNAGNEAGKLKFKVDSILASKIDWRKWLKKYCIQAKASDSSFSNPDKRMFYQNAIYPGQMLDELNSIKGIKVCIDTSGSISDQDLRYIFGQIYKLSKQFKIEAEVIAWDTCMTSCGNLTNTTDIKDVELEGRGGTDPTCLFEYFDSKKCKVKPIVTLVFTDGYWGINVNPKWPKKYKDTLWVMTKDADANFKPPFGLKTKVKYD